MKLRLLFIFLLFTCFSSVAQVRVRGVVKNDEGKTLSGASLFLYYPGSKDTLRVVTNDKGAFIFPSVKKQKIEVLTSFVGYKKLLSNYDYSDAEGEQNIWDIVLSPGDNTLETVTVEAAKIQIKEDTVSYRIDSTMYRKNDNVEEVLKKLPGIEVDRTGKVTAQGKEVTKVKVNGKDFFGGDVQTATRELNADMVDRIQVIDDYGDQAAFTGVRDGEASKTLNIQLKKDKNKGVFGNINAGIGTEDRYQAGVSMNFFNNDRQVSVIGNANNINASTFNFSNMSTMGGMGGMMMGMASSMGIGRGGAGMGSAFGNFGNSNGLNDTKSIGVNFRDQWGPKVSAYGSYSFSSRHSTTLQSVSQQNIQTAANTNLQENADFATNNNHRFSFNIEYKIDSFNYIKFTPNVNYGETDGRNLSDFRFASANGNPLSDGYTNSFTNSKSPNINGNILFNHRFKKRGRTLSLNLSGGRNYTDAENDYINSTDYYKPAGTVNESISQYISQNNDNSSASFRASYIEPLSKTKSLEFNYTYSNQLTSNERETYDIEPGSGDKFLVDTLSNSFDNRYITNRVGLNFRNNQKKFNYSIGLAVQPASISTDSHKENTHYKQNIVNYYPVFRYQYNFSKSRSFGLTYNGSTRQPSYSQLQPGYNYTNPQYITIGNPDLRPEFSNSLSLRYNNFDFITGNVFFGSVNASFTNDKIVSNIFDLGKDSTSPDYKPGAQETRYLNADGTYAISAFYNISRPIKNRKYVFNIGGNISYNNNVSFLENDKNKGKNFILGQRFSMDYKLKKWLETNLAINYALNTSKYSLQPGVNATTQAWTISHNSRLFLPKGIVFTYDMDKTINDGYDNQVGSNPFIINAAIEKQFFKSKKLSLKLSAMDMLNENTSIGRSVSGIAITDTRTNKLGRYFMLGATYRLNKFTGKAPAQQNRVMTGGPGIHGF